MPACAPHSESSPGRLEAVHALPDVSTLSRSGHAGKRRSGLLWTAVLATALGACSRVPDLPGVRVYDHKGGVHSGLRVQYSETPPTGGTHNPVWQNCGVYDKPLYDEYGVHSMEHGAVWITYRPGLPAADVEALKRVVAGHSYSLLSPHLHLKSPVVISAWNRQLSVDRADDPRLAEFMKRYELARSVPERGAACTGGTDLQVETTGTD